MRETYLFVVLAVALTGAGNAKEMRGFAPVVVPKTLPFLKPTTRTLSSTGEIPMALIGVIGGPAEMTWLWRDYDPAKTAQSYDPDPGEKSKPPFRVSITNRSAE